MQVATRAGEPIRGLTVVTRGDVVRVEDAEREEASRAELPHARGVAAGSIELAPPAPPSDAPREP